MFQHTAARRRLPSIVKGQKNQELVSTHSRPKAAALNRECFMRINDVSTHSRPKAAANLLGQNANVKIVSTHSRPKAAAKWEIF